MGTELKIYIPIDVWKIVKHRNHQRNANQKYSNPSFWMNTISNISDKYWEGRGKLKPLCTFGRNQCDHLINTMEGPQSIKNTISLCSTIILVHKKLSTLKLDSWSSICVHVHWSLLKQGHGCLLTPGCPQTEKWIKEVWIQNIISPLKRSEGIIYESLTNLEGPKEFLKMLSCYPHYTF